MAGCDHITMMQQVPLSDGKALNTVTICVKGVVQGVGFRPWVVGLAESMGVSGRVYNHQGAVIIECRGDISSLGDLIEHIQNRPPARAHVTSVDVQQALDLAISSGFSIDQSITKKCVSLPEGLLPITLDFAPCDLCLRELLDPDDRRYRYPFISCADCGPRYSIMQSAPFDRERTSMSRFVLCHACAEEYSDPHDRRFHAQTISCHQCGPKLRYTNGHGTRIDGDPIGLANAALKRGEIVALKGVGGFQLVVDASNGSALDRLRKRKNRPHKPFALMVRNVELAKQIGQLSREDLNALTSVAAPIVLIRARDSGKMLPDAIAPGLRRIGVMLPSSTLHCLLLGEWETPLVVTSGNVSGAPLCVDNNAALVELASIADGFLLYDRDIEHRLDDSVVQCVNGDVVPLRLGRGYAPGYFSLPPGFEKAPSVLAMGADLKNSVCLLDKSGVVLSPYNGDFSDARVIESGSTRADELLNHYDHHPSVVTVDAHPNYFSTAEGFKRGEVLGVEVWPVQHHHAHLAACLADNGWPRSGGAVLGVVLDGMGYGPPNDSTDYNAVWGGELLLGGYEQCRRVTRFKPVPLPGGDMAAKQPWRNALAHLHAAIGWTDVQADYGRVSAIQRLSLFPVDAVLSIMEAKINSPLSSSCGRLFDAVAFLLGAGSDEQMSYEGQGAMYVQSLAEGYMGDELRGYSFDIDNNSDLREVVFTNFWQELLCDLRASIKPEIMAHKFHRGLVDVLEQSVRQAGDEYDFSAVVLSGGVFQNVLITNELIKRLDKGGYSVLTHKNVPPNDSGIAFGQAMIAAARWIGMKESA